ncbi:MAG: DUF4384 domain-containing protein [bacterium]
MNFISLLLVFILFTFNALQSSQDKGKWVEGVGEVIVAEFMTAAEAKQLARSRARNDAIERALGVNISAGQFLQQFEVMRNSGEVVDAGESFAKFIHESRRGRIIQQGKWQEETKVSKNPDGTEIVKRYARNRFYVVAEEKQADPSFQLELSLSKQNYKEGEALSFDVAATQDCYLNVLNLAGNDSVYLMFPNVLEKSNRLLTNEKRRIPGSDYSFTAALPPGKRIAVEYLIAIATKDSLVFRSRETVKPGAGYAQTFKAGLNDVWKWVSEINADRRVEAIESFKIFKK